MKKITYILLLAVMLCPGCSDWLDGIHPKGQTEAKEIYSTEEGFQNVLVGAYISMSGANLYGKNMSMYIPELLAQMWTVGTGGGLEGYGTETAWRRFEFNNDGVKGNISSSWKSYYSTIVNLNSLLGEIDSKKGLFNNGNYELIKGEALGLRAFLHLDILRLWGPVPKDANPSTLAIPYVTKVTRDPNDLISIPYEDVIANIIADLNEAEKLLDNDPIVKFSREVLNTPSQANLATIGDEFHYYRDSRFNLMAVKATKARYYLWIGDTVQARKYAEEVIEMTNPDGNKIYTLANESTLDEGDLLMSTEHIFNVYNLKLGTIVEPLYKPGGPLTQGETQLNLIYNSDDIRRRGNRYWEELTYIGGTANMFKKYVSKEYESAIYVPVIRLAEMYLIAIECAQTPAEAKARYEEFRLARNIQLGDTPTETMNDLLVQVKAEYMKDFFGEGVMFYYYKRNKVADITWPENVTMDVANYVVPKSTTQINFE